MASAILETCGGRELRSLQEWELELFQQEHPWDPHKEWRLSNVGIRLLTAGDREAMIAFVRALPEDDLIFMEQDITQDDEVDAWIDDALEGHLVTLVAWEDDCVVGHVTFHRGCTPWTSHVAELRVLVAESARGKGIGRLLVEMAREMILDRGATKVVARVIAEQTGARELFEQLGFVEEATLQNHALDASGVAHDLLVLSFNARRQRQRCCLACGIPVADALVLDGLRLCPSCYDSRYSELGGG